MKKFLLLLLVIIVCFQTSVLASFKDVKIYSQEIEDLVKKDIIHGYPDNTFKPDLKITRAEFAKMIVLATKSTSYEDNHFSDVSLNHWAREYIDIAATNGFIKGDIDGRFRPEENIKYGEMATIIVRAMGKEKEAEEIELSWPNNYMEMAEKVNLFHDYQGNDLIAINDARRGSAALMIYNMLQQKEIEDTKNSGKKVDTNMAYAGFVNDVMQRNGEPYLVVENDDKVELLLKVYKKAGIPQKKSFVIYQLTSRNELKLRSELSYENIDNTFIKVEKVNHEIVYLEGQEKLLDLDLDSYTLNGKKIRLDKMNYFVLIMKNEEFQKYELYDKQNLELQKDDKIKFNDIINVCYIIREK